jgi:thiosulfate reductase cytochrome b subunit
MSPAATAAYPFIWDIFDLVGGAQSARTIHFFAFVAIVLFVLGHVLMVFLSGFRRQIRSMTIAN